MKSLKKILIVTGCLTIISTSLAFASTNNDVNVSKSMKIKQQIRLQ